MTEKETNPRVRTITIDNSAEGQRLDNFLIKHLKGVPKSRIYRVVRKGEVRVNRRRAKPERRLNQGDLVRIPPLRVAQRTQETINTEKFSWLLERILFEDEALLILDKPSGFSVHGGSRVAFGLVETMRQLRPATPFLELVHRLDKQTSGCLMLAKDRRALTLLHEQLRNHDADGEFEKYYLALVKGGWGKKTRDVKVALQKLNNSQSGHRVVVSEEGRRSHSRIEPRRSLQDASLVRIQLFSGRMHQARVHAAYLGSPIAGDQVYGDSEFNRQMRQHGLRRLFLHAERLCFRHPLTSKKIEVTAPLPADLEAMLETLS